MASLYIHIPFCRSRCSYCGFYSQTHYNLVDDYLQALKQEMHQRANYFDGQTIKTIYIGGGTPSSLPIGFIEELTDEIYRVFSVEVEEFTVEVNPDDVIKPLMTSFIKTGVNRISMGIQTFDDRLLRLINRRHTAEQARISYQTIREAGFNNVSIDLILALPSQTLEDSATDIDAVIKLNPEHISAYLLEYEEGTALCSMLNRGEITPIDDDTQAKIYYQMCQKLCDAGYEHYEISNFARIDKSGRSMRSQHNSSYWTHIPYLGIGAAAHSFNLKQRRWNVSSVTEYIKSTMYGATKYDGETLDDKTIYNEMVMTRLRTIEGIRHEDLATVAPCYREELQVSAKPYLENGLLQHTSCDGLALSHKGLMLSDMIMSDLFAVDED